MTKPRSVKRDFPLSRMTTVRTGGPADYFAAVGSEHELLEVLVWASDRCDFKGVIGSGSNLLVADEGVRGLVLKLEGELAAIEVDLDRVVAGAGARLPQVASKAARAGLVGLGFGVNIPGTVGGAIKMNANAYGGALDEVLEWADVATASGSERRLPQSFNFRYRDSDLRTDEVVVRAGFKMRRGDPDEIKDAMESMRASRRSAQPSGIKTFGSTFVNPDDQSAEGKSAGQMLEAAGCKELEVGGARFNAKHANFVENTGTATTADIVMLMVKGQQRVQERFDVILKPEVQFFGDVEVPASFWGAGS